MNTVPASEFVGFNLPLLTTNKPVRSLHLADQESCPTVKIPRRQHSEMSTESMTPMIDVVFLLLIFFVVASVGQVPDELLPASITEGTTGPVETVQPDELIPPQEIRIKLGRSEKRLVIRLNAAIVTPEELQERLSRLAQIDLTSRVVMDVEDNVLVQHFMTVYERCQVLGFQNISFAVPHAAAI